VSFTEFERYEIIIAVLCWWWPCAYLQFTSRQSAGDISHKPPVGCHYFFQTLGYLPSFRASVLPLAGSNLYCLLNLGTCVNDLPTVGAWLWNYRDQTGDIWNVNPMPSPLHHSLPSSRQHLSSDACLEDKKEDNQKCLCCIVYDSCAQLYAHVWAVLTFLYVRWV